MRWFRKQKRQTVDVEDVLLDSSNIPSFNQARLEGKRELPIQTRTISLVGLTAALISIFFFSKIFDLQVIQGAEFKAVAENNSVNQALIIAERGVIYDRNGELVVWNEVDGRAIHDFPIRAYTDRLGLGQVLGYVSYPRKDNRGFYFRTEYLGRSGVELAYDEVLRGSNGSQIVVVDALSKVVGEHAISSSISGQAIHLSLDAELSEAMYQIISTSTRQADFRSGAGAIMDIYTGELIAMTSFPTYDPEVMANGYDIAKIDEYNNDKRLPFLNKMISGVYTPGSVVKPFVAYAALKEGIITENTVIESYGSLTIPNPYNPSQPSKFNDWRSQGVMTVREAIAFSSNVFFYILGGGLPEIAVPQAGLGRSMSGLGVTKMVEYYRLFGLGSTTGITIAPEQAGVVPDPAWKQEVFNDDWRLGDTYFTSIGQFGFLTTPIQMLRAYAALANGGMLVEPHVIKGKQGSIKNITLIPAYLKIVHEGMRKTVNFDGGTARAFDRKDVAIAAKSGTAEVGAGNAYVNSWAAGFFPYEKPRYAFILMMDKAPRSNALGATRIMGDVVEWMSKNRPEYLETEIE
ncbi:MAG TPA: penicillin-binding transpeptidase domain-containing protein [Candidatus Paceibacterota bacterium]|nr:penicillin-binding transpeptidase domain-containing protein [Candidatus Paceibacterota bacterium]